MAADKTTGGALDAPPLRLANGNLSGAYLGAIFHFNKSQGFSAPRNHVNLAYGHTIIAAQNSARRPAASDWRLRDWLIVGFLFVIFS